MKAARILLAAAAVLLIAACTGNYTSEEIAETAAMRAPGSDFHWALQKAYVREAEIALAESDHQHADLYQLKGRMAAMGEDPQPAVLGHNDWWVPGRSEADIGAARARLMTALSDGHRNTHPEQLANAQVYFDCWVEEEHEDIWLRQPGVLVYQPDDIQRCRDGFEEAMQFDTEAMTYILYFDFDRAGLRPDAQAVMDDVIAAAQRGIRTRINVFAHTDTAGSADYNVGLSERRARSVMEALTGAGVDPSRMTATWFGETRLAVSTPDGAPNQENRRAEIIIE